MPEKPDTQEAATPARSAKLARLLLALVVLQLVAGLFQFTGVFPGTAGRFMDGLLILLATVATLAWLLAQLPLQNVLAASGFLALLFAAAQGVRGIVMLQPSAFSPSVGPQFWGAVPLVLPPMWILALLNSRGTAKLVLAQQRANRVYGFLLIGVSAALFTAFEVALEAYAAGLKSYWMWEHNPTAQRKFIAPASNYLFWFILALGAQVVVAPWLINKKPVEPPRDLSPLVLWGALTMFLGVGAAFGHLWVAAVFSWVIVLFTAGLALAGRHSTSSPPQRQ